MRTGTGSVGASGGKYSSIPNTAGLVWTTGKGKGTTTPGVSWVRAWLQWLRLLRLLPRAVTALCWVRWRGADGADGRDGWRVAGAPDADLEAGWAPGPTRGAITARRKAQSIPSLTPIANPHPHCSRPRRIASTTSKGSRATDNGCSDTRLRSEYVLGSALSCPTLHASASGRRRWRR